MLCCFLARETIKYLNHADGLQLIVGDATAAAVVVAMTGDAADETRHAIDAFVLATTDTYAAALAMTSSLLVHFGPLIDTVAEKQRRAEREETADDEESAAQQPAVRRHQRRPTHLLVLCAVEVIM